MERERKCVCERESVCVCEKERLEDLKLGYICPIVEGR